jgi:hypothetical protein
MRAAHAAVGHFHVSSDNLSNEHIRERSSFDSILDNDRRSSMDNSIFDKTDHRSSMSSDSVFGDDETNVPSFSDQLMLPRQFRPLSMVSLASSPMKEDDTMISVSQLFLCDDVKVLIFCFSPLPETVAGKYYALKRRYRRSRDSEQVVWKDTPFSLFAVQCVYPFTDDFHGTH